MTTSVKIQLMAALALVAVMAVPAWAADSAAGGGIVGSVHDFTSAGGNTGAQYNGAAAIGASLCVFCHIQHRTSSGAANPFSAPNSTAVTRLLWNHKASTNPSFSWSDVNQTQGGTLLPTNLGTWAGSSKNCLGCHDGTVSTGDLNRGVKGVNLNSGWTGTNVTATGLLNRSFLVIAPTGDLRGNHPVGIPYLYQGAPGTYNGITTGSGVSALDYVASPVNVKLFTDTGTSAGGVIQGATVGATGVECASCHDAHNKYAVEEPLLRDFYANSSGHPSQLCLDCHNK